MTYNLLSKSINYENVEQNKSRLYESNGWREDDADVETVCLMTKSRCVYSLTLCCHINIVVSHYILLMRRAFPNWQLPV